LGLLHGGLGISKFLIIKINKKFPAVNFSIFDHENPGSGTGSGSAFGPESGSRSAVRKMPDSNEINADHNPALLLVLLS
jgi:hypothetical protein